MISPAINNLFALSAWPTRAHLSSRAFASRKVRFVSLANQYANVAYHAPALAHLRTFAARCICNAYPQSGIFYCPVSVCPCVTSRCSNETSELGFGTKITFGSLYAFTLHCIRFLRWPKKQVQGPPWREKLPDSIRI